MKDIRHWLESERRPANLYELLGRPTFDPDRPGLLAAVRAAYAQLLPYENHKDREISARAMGLLKELGRAEDLLSDAGKLRVHHAAILDDLRDICAAARAASPQPWDAARLRAWLEERGVHPHQLNWVVHSLWLSEDETVDLASCRTQPQGPPADEKREAFVLEEARASGKPAAPFAGAGPPAAAAPPSDPVVAEVVAEKALAGAAKEQRRPAGRRRRDTADARRRRGLLWVLCVSGGIWLLLVVSVWLIAGTTDTWRGRLLEVRGREGEIHLLIGLDGGASGAAARYLEAFTNNRDFAREIADYGAADEVPSGGDLVVVEGKRAGADEVRFTLRDSSQTVLAELAAIQRESQSWSRAEPGSRRTRFLRKPARSTLAELIRIHPEPGRTCGFHARFIALERETVAVCPSQNDRRTVLVEFPGARAADFAAYRPDDEVYVVAAASGESSADRLVFRGLEIRRLEEPTSPVSAE